MKRTNRLVVLVVVMAVIWLGTGSILTAGIPPTTIVTLQQGKNAYNGCTDTYISKYPPLQVYCHSTQLKVGYKQQYAAFIGWDISAIPIGSTIVSAVMRLYAVGWTPGTQSFEVFEALRKQPDMCRTNWNRAGLGDPWTIPGCFGVGTDRGAGRAGRFTASSGIRQWYDINLVSLVQKWVKGVPSTYTVVIHSNSPSNEAMFFFASSQEPIVMYRPQLVVEYY